MAIPVYRPASAASLLPAALLIETPSIWKLFFSGLAPFTLMFSVPLPKAVPFVAATATPADMPKTAVKFLETSGRLPMTFPATVVPNVEVAVWIASTAASTVTSSLAAPTSNVRLRTAVSVTAKLTSITSDVLKPCKLNRTLYEPGSSSGTR